MPASERDCARLNVTVSGQVLQPLHEDDSLAPLERHLLAVNSPHPGSRAGTGIAVSAILDEGVFSHRSFPKAALAFPSNARHGA